MYGPKDEATWSMRAPAPATAEMAAVTVRGPISLVRSSAPSRSGLLSMTSRTVGKPRSSEPQKYPWVGVLQVEVQAGELQPGRADTDHQTPLVAETQATRRMKASTSMSEENVAFWICTAGPPRRPAFSIGVMASPAWA